MIETRTKDLTQRSQRTQRKEGMNVRDAMITACPTKLKAILMSNIAVILGVIPMALGIGESLAEIRQPMGIVVAGGIVSSMVMTLWLIPCLEFVLSKRAKHSTGNNGFISKLSALRRKILTSKNGSNQ